MDKKSLIGLSAMEISELIGAAGFNTTLAIALAHSIYKKRTTDIGLINTIPWKLKDMLNENFSSGIFPPVASELSAAQGEAVDRCRHRSGG